MNRSDFFAWSVEWLIVVYCRGFSYLALSRDWRARVHEYSKKLKVKNCNASGKMILQNACIFQLTFYKLVSFNNLYYITIFKILQFRKICLIEKMFLISYGVIWQLWIWLASFDSWSSQSAFVNFSLSFLIHDKVLESSYCAPNFL